MIVCGVEMKASEAHLVLLKGSRAEYEHINIKPKKLVLADDENAEEVRAFRDTLYAFIRENNVDVVAIKKRATSGEYAGGAVGFKLEGIAQLYVDCEIRLIASQTIAAAIRRNTPIFPQSLLKYQEAAFETAFTALP
jgi:hypothetical protein